MEHDKSNVQRRYLDILESTNPGPKVREVINQLRLEEDAEFADRVARFEAIDKPTVADVEAFAEYCAEISEMYGLSIESMWSLLDTVRNTAK